MKPIHSALLATVGLTSLVTTLVIIPSRSGHSAGGPITVQVAGTATVKDADNAARQPVQFELGPNSTTSSSATDYYNVPAGKRLVIEYISAQLTQYPSGGYGYMYLVTTAGGDQEYYKVVPPIASTTPENQTLHIYADPGTTVHGLVTQSSGTSCGGVIIVSGYLVNLP